MLNSKHGAPFFVDRPIPETLLKERLHSFRFGNMISGEPDPIQFKSTVLPWHAYGCDPQAYCAYIGTLFNNILLSGLCQIVNPSGLSSQNLFKDSRMYVGLSCAVEVRIVACTREIIWQRLSEQRLT
jgi:hypothetical protein